MTLKAAQDAAEAAGCLLPLSIGSEGTAQLGGILSTNAGGNNTVRYGNARDMVLGLEVVLPDGQVWNGLRRLRKDNTGYCLRQLFVGAEGTLGIITAAVLKLVPRPRGDRGGAVRGRLARGRAGAVRPVSAPRCRRRAGLRIYGRHGRWRLRCAISRARCCRWPRLRRIMRWWSWRRPGPAPGCAAMLEQVLEAALEAGEVQDAVIAESAAQRTALWKLREGHSEAQKLEGASIKNDVSVPVSRVPELIARATAACESLMPGVRVVAFGHMGDGNIHFNLEQPTDMDAAAFLARDHEIMDAVGEVVRDLDGSFSAEHGVGQAEALHDAGLARRRGAGADAADQACHRPLGADESGQGPAAGELKLRLRFGAAADGL